MSTTACENCGTTFEVAADKHYRLVEPEETSTTLLYFCSAACVAENAGLFED